MMNALKTAILAPISTGAVGRLEKSLTPHGELTVINARN